MRNVGMQIMRELFNHEQNGNYKQNQESIRYIPLGFHGNHHDADTGNSGG